MNIYEDELLEQKLEECTDLLGHLLLDLLIVSLKKIAAENQVFSDIADSKLSARMDLHAV
ncbi:MAG: hypothetical protein K0B01_06750 [Syntrophobacterales bacterium]|nr:hypothetical protein [Syntrophobacterales bacterium]